MVCFRYHLLKNQLLITDVTDEDAGSYRCKATNSHANRTRFSHEGRLQVEEYPADLEPGILPVSDQRHIAVPAGGTLVMPCPVTGWPRPRTFNVVITEPVKITVPPVSKQTIRAGTVRFNCTAVGRPAPTITWYKDGKPLAVAGRNPTSSASAWATLNVTGVSAAAPTGVQCWPAGARAVAVRWPKVNADVMAYTVQITTPGGTSLPGQPVIGIEEIISVAEPLTPYGFQVRAYIKSSSTNKNVASDMSESVMCQGQGVPIKLARQGDDILVSWKQFADQTPGVLQWILQYKAENSSDEHNVTLDKGVTNHTIKVPSEEPLQVRVLGTRMIPWLHQNLTLVPWTSTTIAIHAPDGGEVTAVPEDVEVTDVKAREFTVRWRCEESELSLETYTYMVCTRKVDGNEECMESRSKSIRIDKLSPSTEYEVRVQARIPARMAVGEFSKPIHIRTQAEGTKRFENLSYTMVNTSALRVSWNSLPDKYTIHYSNELTLPINQWPCVDTVGNTVVISGLEPDLTTYVMVVAPGPSARNQVVNILPRPPDQSSYYLSTFLAYLPEA
ncbi:hypothetical protein HF086_013872 [Spodoptera exigua]|uniref:Fibronectin type III domain protein n=1 Tax=Spodoptera exigua TaxID=7107 RepID=A0A922MIF2_SPOEX|nr:hypothetical protein HF086_013872 [Spodoptera exigua]